MTAIRVRVGSWSPPRFRRKPVISRNGRICIVREDYGRYSLVHAPTGLGLHHRLQGLRLSEARRALALAAPLCDWDWTDPEWVKGLHWRQSLDLWDALVTIAEMVEAV